MIRRLPEYHLFPCNNKVWHGTAALHLVFSLMVPDYHSLQQENTKDFFYQKAEEFTAKNPHLHKKMILFTMAGIPAPELRQSSLSPVLPAFLSVSGLSGSTGPSLQSATADRG